MKEKYIFFWLSHFIIVILHRETSFSSTACHNKAIMAEGFKPIALLRRGFFCDIKIGYISPCKISNNF